MTFLLGRGIGRVFDHVTLRVADLDASRRFYDTVLGVLGLKNDEPEYPEWGDFSIAADGQPLTQHLHIAFFAPSHELVDAFHRAGVEAGYPTTAPPARARSTARTTTAASCATPTATASRPSTSEGAQDRGRSTTSGCGRATSPPHGASTRRSRRSSSSSVRDDSPDHVQIVSDGVSFSFVTGEPATEHVHIAFSAATTTAVDAFHAAATEAGYRDNGAPGERPIYHPGYYGAFVLDPDGHNIEAVNHNRTTAS